MGWLRLMWRRLGSWGPVVTGHCLSAGLSVPVRSAGGAVKLGEVHWGGAACYSVRPPTRGLKRDTEMSAALENEDSRKIQLFGIEDELMSVVTKKTAKLLASKRSLRLVEIDSTAKPHPTYQLMTGTDLHGLQVQQRQKKKASKSTEKNVRVATKISEHDLEIKLKQVHDHLTKGHHVRFTVTTKKSKISEPQDSGGSDHGRIIRTLGERLDSVATVTKAVDDGKILVVLLRPLIEEPGAQKDTATTAD